MRKTLRMAIRAANIEQIFAAMSKVDTSKLTDAELDTYLGALESVGVKCADILVKYGDYDVTQAAIAGLAMKFLGGIDED